MKTKVKVREVKVNDWIAYRGQWIKVMSAIAERNNIVSIFGTTDDGRTVGVRLQSDSYVYQTDVSNG